MTDIVAARLVPAARLAFAAALAGLGATGIVFADFALQWQPVPADILGRTALAVAAGVLLALTGAGLALRRLAFSAAVLLCVIMAAWVLALHLPRVLTNVPWAWLGFFEFVAIFGAALILTSFLAQDREGRLSRLFDRRAARIGLLLFAVSTPFFGLSHVISVAGAARFVPAWLPGPEFWVVATAIGHAAAGVSLLTGVLTRLATALYGVMIASFVLTVHVPDVLGDPASHRFWVMLFVAMTIFAAALTIAAQAWSARLGPLGRVTDPQAP